MADRPTWFRDLLTPPVSIPAKATRPAPVLFDDQHRPITSAEAWTSRREELVRRWRSFLGEIPRPSTSPNWTVLEADDRDEVHRELIRYESEPGLRVEGYLLRPRATGDAKSTRMPGVVVFHSTVDYTIRQPAGLEGPPEKFIALHLAQRGFVTFAPRCFLWQYSKAGKIAAAVDWLRTRHPLVRGMAKMLYDAQRAVDLIAAVPTVDAGRLGAIGHSLGAKEVLYLAAFDARIRATVSSEGGIALSDSNWEAPWYLGDAIRKPGFPLDHAQLLALIAPRAFLLLGGDSADGDASWPTIAAGAPVWKLLGSRDSLGFFNHRQGHAFPPEASRRAYEWLEWFLRA